MINDRLSISAKGLELLKGIEQLMLKPYDDQTKKPIDEWCKGATIGWGHLIPHSDWARFKNGIGIVTAMDLLALDISPLEMVIRKAVIVPLTQNQFDALLLLAFNIGSPRFRTSSLEILTRRGKRRHDQPPHL